MAFDTFKVFDRVWHVSLLHKLKSYGISGQVFSLISFFPSVIDSSEWFWMGILCKNIHLMLVHTPKAPFLVQHFSYYALMTFLMILPPILLSMLMILLSSLMWSRTWLCGNNWSWFLNLNLIQETLWNGAGSGLMISMLAKISLFFFLIGLITPRCPGAFCYCLNGMGTQTKCPNKNFQRQTKTSSFLNHLVSLHIIRLE